MQQDSVQPACPLAASGFADDRRAGDVAGALILRAKGGGDWFHRRTRVFERLVKLRHQWFKPATANRHRFNHGDAKRPSQ